MVLKNGLIFLNRQEDKYNSEEIIKDLEELVEFPDELDAVILQNNRLEAVHQSTRWYGYNGVNVKRFLEEWRNKLKELNKFKKDTVTAQFVTGHMITISKSYGDHIFSDQEIKDLFEGKSIVITFNTQWGNERTVQGKIEKKDWPEKEIEFYTFVTQDLNNIETDFVEGLYQGEKIKFKNKFADYKFTQEDIDTLLNAKPIYCIITNSNGNRTAVRLTLVHMKDNYYKLNPAWDVPRYRFSKYDREFTSQELEQLDNGHSIILEGSAVDGSYTKEIRWKDGQFQIKKERR